MPNYKVRIEFEPETVMRASGHIGVKLHAAEVYVEAPAIMVAGNAVIDLFDHGISLEATAVTKIVEVESKDPKDVLHPPCGYFFSVVPPLKFACRNDHIEFRRRTGIAS